MIVSLPWAFHDQDHIQQILEVLKQRSLPHFTEAMRSALVDDAMPDS